MCTRRTWRLALAAAILPTLSYAAGFGDPLPGLTPEQQIAFQDGKTAFVAVEDATEGLGPIFNENSCATCHVGPAGAAAMGAVGGTTERLETRFGKSVYDAFDPLANKGGSLLQDHAIGAAAQYQEGQAGGGALATASRSRVSAHPPAAPRARPVPTIQAPSPMTRPKISRGRAPSAMRSPISPVRWPTEYAITP